MALSCSAPPAATVAVPGATSIAVRVAALTVIDAVADLPPAVAVKVAVPVATAWARPEALTVATATAELFQVALAVRSCVLPSE